MRRDVIMFLREMLPGTRLERMFDFYQHGDTRCLAHTLGVVFCALMLSELFHIKVSRRELIRGGILHDYFLYDWHDGKKERRIHGFTHPSCALRNAEEDFELTDRERDIIRKHMFPLTLKPPICREAWLICLADKICAVREVFKKDAYPEINKMMERQRKYTGKTSPVSR